MLRNLQRIPRPAIALIAIPCIFIAFNWISGWIAGPQIIKATQKLEIGKATILKTESPAMSVWVTLRDGQGNAEIRTNDANSVSQTIKLGQQAVTLTFDGHKFSFWAEIKKETWFGFESWTITVRKK